MKSIIERAQEKKFSEAVAQEPPLNREKFLNLSYEDKRLEYSVLSEKVKNENKKFFENFEGLVEWNNSK